MGIHIVHDVLHLCKLFHKLHIELTGGLHMGHTHFSCGGRGEERGREGGEREEGGREGGERERGGREGGER